MPDCHEAPGTISSAARPQATRLCFEGRPSAGPPRIIVRLAHPAASTTRAYVARFDLSIATTAIPSSAARALDLGTVRDEHGLLHTQVCLIFERNGALSVSDGSALVVPDSLGTPEVTLGRDVLCQGVLTMDGPADRWSWTIGV
jgi:hypothetical protein